MVEFIGAAAAGLQLARYSVSAANAVPDFARRVRKAPVTQDRWTDQATLLTTTSQQAYQHINGSTALSPIINRLTEHLECVRSQLHQTALDTDDGKIARLRKKIRVVRRENELDKEIQAISQQIMLCSQFATLYCMENTSIAGGQFPPVSSSTLVPHTTQRATTPLPMLPNHLTLPNAHSLQFVGRVDLLNKLLMITNGLAGSITAITGLGGIGKSKLAVRLIQMLLIESPDLPVFWLDATTDETLTVGLRIINALANPSKSTPEAVTPSGIESVSTSAITTCLLIIDNVDLGSFVNPVLESLLHPMRDRHIVFITRNRRLALRYAHPTEVIDVPALSEGDAQNLLLSYIGPHAAPEECAKSLTRKLAYHPLAIKSAGIYITSTGSSLTSFLSRLEKDPPFLSELFEQTSVGNECSVSPTQRHDSVFALKSLAASSSDAVATLFLMSCLNCSDIPDDIITAIADTNSRREAINVLQAYSLLKPSRRTGSWEMPETVRLTAKGQLLHSPDRARSLAFAVKLIFSLETAPTGEPHGLLRHHSHVASILDSVITLATELEFSPVTIKLAFHLSTRLCQYLVDEGEANEAVATTFQFISWAKVSAAKFISAYDRLRSNLGVAYHGSGQFAIAENIAREVIRSQIHIMGKDDLETIHSLNNIGVYELEQGRSLLAERCHRKVLVMKLDRFGSHHLEVFLTLNNLALSLQKQRNFEEAEIYFAQALRGRKGRLPRLHPDVLVSMSNLGVLKQLQGRIQHSRQLHEVALEGRELVLGETHPETLKSKGNLALILQCQGQYEQSAELLRGVCQAYKVGLGISHPDTIKSLRNLALILHRQSKFAEAEALTMEILDTLEETHGKGHCETFKTLQYLATLFHWQGRPEEALDTMASLYDMQKAMLESDHPDTINSRLYLAELEAELVATGQGSSIMISFVI